MQWLLTTLLVLVCPIMMLYMMKGMHRGDQHGTGCHKYNHEQDHLDKFKKENERLIRENQELKNL